MIAQVDLNGLKEAQAVIRSSRLRYSARYLPYSALRPRITYFTDKEVRNSHRKRIARGTIPCLVIL